MGKTTLLAATLVAALAGLAHAQPAEPGSPAPMPAPVPAAAPDDPAVDGDQADEVGGDPDPQTATRPGEALEPDDGASGGGKSKNKDKKPKDPAAEPPEIEVSGRVFLRATAYDEDINPWVAGFSLDSARFQINYQWKNRVAAEVSAEIRGRGSIRDAYIDVRLTDCLELRGGRYKIPATAIERTSTWTLPTIDRPITATILDAGMGVSGRRNGAMLVWKPAVAMRPKVEASVSQSMDVLGEELPRILDEGAGVTVAVRGELRPYETAEGSDVMVGAYAQTREFFFGAGRDRYWAGGVDLEADLAGPGLRVWADVVGGTGHWAFEPIANEEASVFVAAQTVVGWRRGGADRGKKFVELFGGAAYMDPSLDVDDDTVMEGKVGIGGGRWKRWRGQLQFALQEVGDARPGALGGVEDLNPFEPNDFNDRITISAQLGAAF